MLKKIVIWMSVLSVVGLGIAWGAGYFDENPHIVKIEEIRQQLNAPDQQLTSDQRRDLWGQMRKESEQLTDDQRHQMWEAAQEDMQRRMEQKLDAYFALPPEQRVAALDKEIDESEARRKQFEKWRKEREAKEQASGDKKSGSSSSGNGEANRDGNRRGPGGSGSGRGPRDEKSRQDSRKRSLDRTSPEMRGKMAQHAKELDQRRVERGLPPSPWPRRG